MCLKLYAQNMISDLLKISIACVFSLFLTFNAACVSKFKNDLSDLPVLHDGRIKPLVSLSDTVLLNVYGKKNIDNLNSVEWMCELFFLKDKAYKRNIFFIRDVNVLLNIGVKPKITNRYSVDDLAGPLLANIYFIKAIEDIDYNLRTSSQIELLNLYLKFLFILRIDLLTSPLFLNKKDTQIDLSSYDNLKQFLVDTTDIYLFPSSSNSWSNMSISQEKSSYFVLMKDILNAYFIDDHDAIKKSCFQLKLYSYSFFPTSFKNKIKIEAYYSCLSPVFISFLFYFLSIFFLIVSFIKVFTKRARTMAVFVFLLALFVHVLAIFIRMCITGRAPVATLFESVLFVNAVFALSVVLIILINTNYKYVFFICGCLAVCILQYIVYAYELDGDSITVLLPVLNTNFWLTVHVLVISIGYSLCLISSVVAHVFLFYYARSIRPGDFLKSLNIINIMCILALLFSSLGTILGGIWADQSWGRFWGWDPKENGALLIVLWLTFVLHFRLTGFFSIFLSFILVVLNGIIVFIAWFGVNLLNSGLHSYGFVQNIGQNLLIYCVFEFIFIFIVGMIYYFNKKRLAYQTL